MKIHYRSEQEISSAGSSIQSPGAGIPPATAASGATSITALRDGAKLRGFSCASEIASLAAVAPPTLLDVGQLLNSLGERGQNAWRTMEAASGITERRHHLGAEPPSHLAAEAALEALRLAHLTAPAVDLILYCGVTRDYLEPATATRVQALIGNSGAIAFDISNACLGFVDGLLLADAWIGMGRASNALVVSAELGTNYAIRGAQAIDAGGDARLLLSSLTLGDGAAAAVVVPKHSQGVGIQYALRESYGEHSGLCVINKADALMHTHPTELIQQALLRTPIWVDEILRRTGWERAGIDRVISHQITTRHLHNGGRAGGFESAKMEQTVDRYGNMGSVSVPFTLAQALSRKAVCEGSQVLIAGFGSGLGMSMVAIRLGQTQASVT